MALIMTNTACAQEFEKDTFKAPSGKEIEIYAIKHGSMRIVFDGKEIEVDPVEALEPAIHHDSRTDSQGCKHHQAKSSLPLPLW